MTHYRNNIEQALRASEDLFLAVTEQQWDKVEGLIRLRDQAVDIAFPDNLPVSYYKEARQAFSTIRRQQFEVVEISKNTKRTRKNETIGEKRGRRSIQSYLD